MAVDASPSTPTITLDPASVEALADLLSERIAARLPQSPDPEIGWLATPDAAAYLGISTTALHKLTSARLLAFSQSAPGGRCFFRRADLDAYREQSLKGGGIDYR